MSDDTKNPPREIPPPVPGGDFYITGGTLRPDAPSYVERHADKELGEGLLRGEFCYVLTSRQMGKSSLMVRTVGRLRQEGAAVAVLDLTAIGQNVTIEQWYDGLVSRLGQQLSLEDELVDFWASHSEWGPLQRFLTALEKIVLERCLNRVVIFVDEIDIVRSLPFSTDEFFAAIRECYNRRSREKPFTRLAFGLLGVAAPSDLIRDTRMTPFNIGRRIELNDFNGVEALALAKGLCADEKIATDLLARILFWTGGHPYLTQRLCRAVAESVFQPQPADPNNASIPPVLPTAETVDLVADKLFLSRQARDRDDNLIFVRERILRSEGDVAGLLYLYRKILTGVRVPEDEANPFISILRLSGIARGVNGYLRVRNRIYARVFDLVWIQTNMPKAEVRRQRRATRRGMLVGFGSATIILLAVFLFGPAWKRYRQARLAYNTAKGLETTYAHLQSYRDTFETTLNFGWGGTTIPVNGSGSLIFERPNKVDLALKSSLHWPEIEVRLLSDGEHEWVYELSANQYQVSDRPTGPTPFDFPHSAASRIGPLRVLPVYRLLLAPRAEGNFMDSVRNLRYAGDAELKGEPFVILHWDHDAGALLNSLGLTNSSPQQRHIPVVAWVNRTNFLVSRIQMDLTPWVSGLSGSPSEIPVTGLQLTESHGTIQTTPSAPSSTDRFAFVAPAGASPVSRLELPPPNFSTLASSRRLFFQLIPPRIPFAPQNLVDLTDYYNAALTQSWHPGLGSNSLDVLPAGLLQLGGTTFDVRGIIQLAGLELQAAAESTPGRDRFKYPQQVLGIKIGQACRQLHFLHATGWRARDGTRIGDYIIHFKGSQEISMPVIYGEDVRDWNSGNDVSTQLNRSSIVWSLTNRAGFNVRLFKTTWVNPMPEVEIVSLDYVSTMTSAAPFLIAVTAER